MRWLILPLVLVVAGAGAMFLRKSEPAAPRAAAAEPLQLTVTARDYVFELPDSVPAGVTTINLVNQGPEFHHVQLVRIEDGHTVAEFLDALRAGGMPPAWVREIGGPNTPLPGGTAQATVELEPGPHAVVCFIPSADGVPHIAKGMVQPFEVTGVAGPAPEVTPDIEMVLSDYDFTLSKPLAPGRQVMRVHNSASQAHEVFLVQLDNGKTAADFLAWFESNDGPPPGRPAGGITAIAKGISNDITLDLTQGDYLLICFVPDAGDGKPHFVHGMMKTLTVG